MINKETIRDDQYKNSNNLQARISIHQDYTRKYPNFWEEIVKSYPMDSAQDILEFGCGTGVFWRTATSHLAPSANVLLTDISEGMLETTRSNIDDPRFSFEVGDIDHKDFTKKFDLILCHFMLYYSENSLETMKRIKKFLKPGGRIAIATLGPEHMNRFNRELHQIIKENKFDVDLVDQANAKNFSEDTADREINEVFNNVQKISLDDFLDITDVEPIIDYCRSTMRFGDLDKTVYDLFRSKINDEIKAQGKYIVSKRVVLYICQ